MRTLLDLITIFSTCFLALVQTNSSAQLELELNRVVRDHEVNAIAVVAVCGSEKITQFHYEDDNTGKINEETLFPASSISKIATASAFMRLVDRAELTIDSDVSKFLGFELRHPDFPDMVITPRMLMSHTSGLSDSDGTRRFLFDTQNDQLNLPMQQQLFVAQGTYYDNHTWNAMQPGTYFDYADINFALIASIIEKVSGKRFDKFMHEQLFAPLSVQGTFDHTQLTRRKNRVNANHTGRKVIPADYQLGTNGFLFNPHNGLWASTNDILRLMMLHMGNGVMDGNVILTPLSIEEMHKPHWSFNGQNGNTQNGIFMEYGLGVQRTTNAPLSDLVFAEFNMYGHIGRSEEGIALFFYDPESEFGLVALSNVAGNNLKSGKTSAFHLLEEELISAIHDYSLPLCKYESEPLRHNYHLSVNPIAANEFVSIRSLSSLSPKSLVIRNSEGMVFWEQSIEPAQIIVITVSNWPKGAYQIETYYNNLISHTWFNVVE